MGQKTSPIGFRLGIVKPWRSRWYNHKNMPEWIAEDQMVRRYLRNRLSHAAISRVDIERTPQRITVIVYTARPGVVIGRKGSEVDKLRDELARLTDADVSIKVEEVKRPELDAQLVADNIAFQLAQRISHRRAMKKAVTSALRLGADGIRIACAGRLGGAEIARREWYRDGRVPLHTIRADIDYGLAEAHTTFGAIGVKVWIFKGEVLPAQKVAVEG